MSRTTVMRVRPSQLGGPPRLQVVLPPRPESLTDVRRHVRDWLAELGAAEADAADLVLACNEACANSIENAAVVSGPNAFVLSGRVVLDSIVLLSVRDYGRWRFARRRPERGRGLELIRELSDHVAIRRHADGSEVTFYRQLELSRPFPRGPTAPGRQGRPPAAAGSELRSR